MAQRAILLSSRSLNGREFPQSILKFLTVTEDEAKQYLMDCIDNDIKENMNLNEIANNLNIFNVKENSFCMLKNDSDYLSQDVLTSGVRRIADRNHYVVDIVEMGNAGEKCYLFRKIKRCI